MKNLFFMTICLLSIYQNQAFAKQNDSLSLGEVSTRAETIQKLINSRPNKANFSQSDALKVLTTEGSISPSYPFSHVYFKNLYLMKMEHSGVNKYYIGKDLKWKTITVSNTDYGIYKFNWILLVMFIEQLVFYLVMINFCIPFMRRKAPNYSLYQEMIFITIMVSANLALNLLITIFLGDSITHFMWFLIFSFINFVLLIIYSIRNINEEYTLSSE